MPQEDYSASKLNHPEEIIWVVLPANDDATIIMEPSKQTLDFPPTTVAAQRAAVLGDRSTAVPAVRRDQFHTELFAYPLIQRIAVVGFIADQSLRRLAEESALVSARCSTASEYERASRRRARSTSGSARSNTLTQPD